MRETKRSHSSSERIAGGAPWRGSTPRISPGIRNMPFSRLTTADPALHRVAHVRRQLVDARVQLRLQESGQLALLGAGDEPLDRGHELERFRVEDPHFFFYSDRERAAEVLFDHGARTPCTGPPAASHA